MTLNDFYNQVRNTFPQISTNADLEHIRLWDDVSADSAFIWFESLATALNQEMSAETPAADHKDLLFFIAAAHKAGDETVSRCIDVSFVENLFHQILPAKANPYWQLLPANLKDLYIRFHSKKPV